MKTKEFIGQVQDLGFEVLSPQNGSLYINYLDVPIASVELFTENVIHFESGFYGMIGDVARRILLYFLYTYASTPLEDREDHEKEYYIKHKYFSDENGYLNYLDNEDEPEEEKWFLSDIAPEVELDALKISFTLEELPDWVHKMIEDGYMIKEEI